MAHGDGSIMYLGYYNKKGWHILAQIYHYKQHTRTTCSPKEFSKNGVLSYFSIQTIQTNFSLENLWGVLSELQKLGNPPVLSEPQDMLAKLLTARQPTQKQSWHFSTSILAAINNEVTPISCSRCFAIFRSAERYLSTNSAARWKVSRWSLYTSHTYKHTINKTKLK